MARTLYHTGPKRVALAGFYGHGNFGDDLMAVLFGLFLRREGIPFSVSRLCQPYAHRFAFQVAESADELLEGADVLLWGGGGLLVSWSRLTYNLLYPSVARVQGKLIRAAIERRVRLIASSVGGDGKPMRRLTPSHKELFVSAVESITVRNPQDREALRERGLEAPYFPDIVWQTSKVFPCKARKRDRLRIGLDIYPSNLARTGGVHLVPALQAVVWKRRDCEFLLIDGTNRSRKPYRGLGLVVRGSNAARYQFCELEEDLEFLASLDFLVSTRYHLPMVAMQYGVPVVAVLPEAKTRLFWQNLGLARYVYGHRRLGELISLLLSRDLLRRFLDGYAFPDIPANEAGSAGHLELLRKILKPAGTC